MDVKEIACFSNELLRAPVEILWTTDETRFFIGIISKINPLSLSLKTKVMKLKEINHSVMMVRKNDSINREEKINQINFLNKKKESITFDDLTFTRKQFIDLIGNDHRISNKKLLEITLEVQKKSILLDLYDNFEHDVASHIIFPEVSYDFKNDILSVRIKKELMPHFIDLAERFTYIDPIKVSKISSAKSARAYLLCKSYLWYCSKYNKWINYSIEDFKKYLGIGGLYPNNRNIKQKVFDPCFESINLNMNLDINIEYKLIRTNKKYTDVTFLVKPNINSTKEFSKLIECKNAKDMLMSIGVKEHIATDLHLNYSEQIIFDIIFNMLNSIDSGKKVINQAGFVIDTLKRMTPDLKKSSIEEYENDISQQEKEAQWLEIEDFIYEHRQIIEDFELLKDDEFIYHFNEVEFFKKYCCFLDQKTGLLNSNRAILNTQINNASRSLKFYIDLSRRKIASYEETKKHIYRKLKDINNKIDKNGKNGVMHLEKVKYSNFLLEYS